MVFVMIILLFVKVMLEQVLQVIAVLAYTVKLPHRPPLHTDPSLYQPASDITQINGTAYFLYLWKFGKSTTSLNGPDES